MRTLVVGIGALGGLIAARLRAVGSPVWPATRNAESAARLKASGLRLTGVGGAVSVETVEVFLRQTRTGVLAKLRLCKRMASYFRPDMPRPFSGNDRWLGTTKRAPAAPHRVVAF
jgi:hypothetical protein